LVVTKREMSSIAAHPMGRIGAARPIFVCELEQAERASTTLAD
jgi:hypothetical protein